MVLYLQGGVQNLGKTDAVVAVKTTNPQTSAKPATGTLN
jgi:hypothetical protein